jgi:hypothetical protein
MQLKVDHRRCLVSSTPPRHEERRRAGEGGEEEHEQRREEEEHEQGDDDDVFVVVPVSSRLWRGGMRLHRLVPPSLVQLIPAASKTGQRAPNDDDEGGGYALPWCFNDGGGVKPTHHPRSFR